MIVLIMRPTSVSRMVDRLEIIFLNESEEWEGIIRYYVIHSINFIDRKNMRGERLNVSYKQKHSNVNLKHRN